MHWQLHLLYILKHIHLLPPLHLGVGVVCLYPQEGVVSSLDHHSHRKLCNASSNLEVVCHRGPLEGICRIICHLGVSLDNLWEEEGICHMDPWVGVGTYHLEVAIFVPCHMGIYHLGVA